MLKTSFKLMAIGLSLATLVACGSKESAKLEHDSHANHDIQEKTASIQALPTFLDKQPDQVRLAYQIAGLSTDLLQWIPCYCGCGESAGHKSNMNCFVQQINPDGSVVWDDHGTRCGVCLNIAVESARMLKDGKSAKEIRDMIDLNYKTGYAKPTPTPKPV